MARATRARYAVAAGVTFLGVWTSGGCATGRPAPAAARLAAARQDCPGTARVVVHNGTNAEVEVLESRGSVARVIGIARPGVSSFSVSGEGGAQYGTRRPPAYGGGGSDWGNSPSDAVRVERSCDT